jgi:hypothetical protein
MRMTIIQSYKKNSKKKRRRDGVEYQEFYSPANNDLYIRDCSFSWWPCWALMFMSRYELAGLYPAKSKIEIDKIDQTLAKYYGFTVDELDFIINYDIKYRMGADEGGNEV